MKTVIVQQMIAPSYRVPLFRLLASSQKYDLHTVAGRVDFSPTMKTDELALDSGIVVAKNYYFLGRRLAIQSRMLDLINTDVVVLSFNLRIISNLVVAWIRKMLRKPTLFWGHIDGRSSITRRFSWLYLSTASGFITYTQTQAEELSSRYTELSVIAAANACFHAGDCRFDPVDHPRDIVFLGRLIDEKRPNLLLDAYISLLKQTNCQVGKLIFIGTGPAQQSIEAEVLRAGLTDKVSFEGYISDISRQRELFAGAICCVSPGYVGLSVTQSLAFGVPVVVADDEPHSPEIEACLWGENALSFKARNTSSLVNTLDEVFRNREYWAGKRSEISETTAEKYSYEKMAESFEEMITSVS